MLAFMTWMCFRCDLHDWIVATHNLIPTGLPLSSSLTRGTFSPPLMMTTTGQLTLKLATPCYCTHCHSLTLRTSHTPHTLHFAWHLFLFHIMTFITQNRNLFCIHVTVINFCLKTLQTPAEEMVNLCAIASCISQSNLWPLNGVWSFSLNFAWFKGQMCGQESL